jgi:adenylate cyclase
MQDRLDSWKEIATYLKRGARTVQRWERAEGLPVHRLQHDKLGSVYAFTSELDRWWCARGTALAETPQRQSRPGPTVAVLPFADMSQEKDQAYFCDGIAEEIINSLSRIGSLRVSSRTSSFQFGTAGTDTREIGRKLRVGALLEGSVRKSGDRLRITVQLTEAENGYQLWAARYDGDLQDIFSIQDEIAESVVRALEVRLAANGETALRKPPTTNVRAFDFYLRGRSYYYQYSPRGVEFALQMFIRAIELDSDYAQAYAGLADCWSYVYLYSNRSETVRGQADWASLKAVEMDPASASAQASRGLSLSLQGRDEEAANAFQRAKQLDPGLFEAYYFHARHAFTRGHSETAAHLYEEAMRVRPEDYQSPLLVAQIYDDLGRAADAVAARRRGVEIAEARQETNPDDARALYMAANGLVALGERDRGRRLAERALAIQPDDPMLLYNVGCIFSMLGLIDQALECLEKAAATGLTEKAWYEHDNNLDAARDHPRFRRLLEAL